MLFTAIYSISAGSLLGVRSAFTKYTYRRYLIAKGILSSFSMIEYLYYPYYEYRDKGYINDVSTGFGFGLGIINIPLSMTLMTSSFWLSRLAFKFL